MDPPIQISKLQNCDRHNKPIKLYDPDLNEGAYCLICIQEKTGMISEESYQQKLKIIIQQETQINKNNIQLFQDWQNAIQIYKQNFVTSLDEILKAIDDQMKIFTINIDQLQQLSLQSTYHQKTFVEIQLISQNSQEGNKQMKIKVKQQLLDFSLKYFNNFDELLNQLDQKPEIKIKVAQMDNRKFQYELIKQSCKKVNQCYAFALNTECNILFVANDKQIIVYQFNKGTIVDETQRLTDHTDYVDCLYFMKQSNSLVSGSKDNTIIIWDFRKDKNQWYALSQLKDHTSSVYRIQMNKYENLLISGSYDKTIKFWEKSESRWSVQQTYKAKRSGCLMSLNEQANKLILCGSFSIFILEKRIDNTWREVQQLECFCMSACFTVEDQIVAQPFSEIGIVEVHNYNHSKQKFEKVQEVQLQQQNLKDECFFFQCQYSQKLNIAVVGMSNYLYILKIDQNERYQVIQMIELETVDFYGILSEDGEYLITWGGDSIQIQVRSLKYVQ